MKRYTYLFGNIVEVDQNILTAVLDFAIVIFFTHAVFEYSINLIVLQSLT